jgi:hypothetical protein
MSIKMKYLRSLLNYEKSTGLAVFNFIGLMVKITMTISKFCLNDFKL